jgi:hypothetical protein
MWAHNPATTGLIYARSSWTSPFDPVWGVRGWCSCRRRITARARVCERAAHKQSNYYADETEGGSAYNEPDVGIE